MSQWTNLHNLPAPVVRLVENPTYHEEREAGLKGYLKFTGLPETTPHFSVSELIKAPRQVILTKRHGSKVVRDVSDGMWAMLGSMLHEALRRAAAGLNDEGAKLVHEVRLFATTFTNEGKVILTGEPDIIDEAGNISDYKMTSVYAFQKGKAEWEQQLNAYSWLRMMNKLPQGALTITAFLRDWMKSETVKADYPQAQCQVIEVTTWEPTLLTKWIHARLQGLVSASQLHDDQLPECSPEDMWERPETWAVMKKGAARATKVFKIAGEEGNNQALAYQKEKGDDYSVEHRPGERVKCSRGYCDAASFCNQFQEYKAAAWGKMPVKQGDDK